MIVCKCPNCDFPNAYYMSNTGKTFCSKCKLGYNYSKIAKAHKINKTYKTKKCNCKNKNK